MNLLLLLLAADLPAPDTTATDDTDAPATAHVCDGAGDVDGLSQALSAVGASAQARDIEAFRVAYQEITRRTPCLQTVASPGVAAGLHAARYLALALEGDRDGMAQALLGATTVPGTPPPAWLSVPEGAVIAEPMAPMALDTPPYTSLFVDGLPARSRPVDRPALYQAVGAGGRVLWTRMLEGDEPLPDGFSESVTTRERPGSEVLDEVTTLLSEARYQEVIDVAIPAAALYPELQAGFRAAADLAADQIRRTQVGASQASPYAPYAPRPRRGAIRRGDERKGFLLGFDVGVPTSVHGEWKIGRSAVDGIGLKIGAGAMLYDASVFAGVDSSIYLDWNLSGRWQLQTTVLGVFVAGVGSSPYANFGVAVQYDPPSPLEITVGARAGAYGVLPQATVGFLW